MELYSNHQINLLNPQILYKTNATNFNTQLLQINREKEIFVTIELKNLTIVKKESIRKIKQSGMKLVHLGLIVVGVIGLVRKNLGTKILIAILEKGWQTDARNALIAVIEVDMSNNMGIFYCSPDFSISVLDLKLIEIGVQTKGY